MLHSDEVPTVQSESNGLYERMCLLETGIYSVFWNDIFERVNATSRKLQDSKLDVNAAVAMVVSNVKPSPVRTTWSNSIWHIILRTDSPASTQCSLRLWSGVGC